MLDFHPAFKNLQAPVKRQPFLEKAISGCLFLSISCTSYISTDSHKTWERKTSLMLRERKRPSVILIGFFIPVQLRGPWGTETLNKTHSLEVIFARFWWRSQTYTLGSSPWILLQADTWNVSWNGWSTVHIHLPPLPLVWDPHTSPPSIFSIQTEWYGKCDSLSTAGGKGQGDWAMWRILALSPLSNSLSSL